MATTDLNRASFEQAIADNDIVLVDFWAAWCGPCRQFAPVYEAASEQHPEIVFGKVDTEAERDLAGAAGISSIPTLMAFREGVLVFAQPGALPAAALEQVIEAVKGLDMTEVHRQVAQQRRADENPLEVSVADLAAAIDEDPETVIVDVREPGEYAGGHVPGAILMPLRIVPAKQLDLPKGKRVFVICATGNRSRAGAQSLREGGFDAVSVAGGTSGWAAAGHPVVSGTSAR